MNKKLIAAAVSTAVMAPVAAQAADVTVYGRINQALEFRDPDVGSSSTDISSVASRFGIKASSDLGNGLTASAQYEFATVTDRELNNIADLRVGTVGLSGGFGSITVGNQWSAFYDTVGTDIDPTYTIGYVLYSSITGGPYRASNTIKYANSFGPVYLEADFRINDSDDPGDVEKIAGDGGGIGARWSVTDNLTLAAAFDTEDGEVAGVNDVDRTGVSGKWASGGWFAILGWHEWDDDVTDVSQTQLWVGVDVGDATRLLVGYGVVDDGTNADPSAINLGVYHNMGGGLRLWYEGGFHDFDGGTAGADFDRHLFGMRIDF